jgi:hypothetical protein
MKYGVKAVGPADYDSETGNFTEDKGTYHVCESSDAAYHLMNSLTDESGEYSADIIVIYEKGDFE